MIDEMLKLKEESVPAESSSAESVSRVSVPSLATGSVTVSEIDLDSGTNWRRLCSSSSCVFCVIIIFVFSL